MTEEIEKIEFPSTAPIAVAKEIKEIRKPKVTKEPKEVKPKEFLSKDIIKPKETKENRVTKGFTLNPQLVEEIIKRAKKADVSESRFVEITLRKALRL